MAAKRTSKERVQNYPSLFPELEVEPLELEIDFPEIEVEPLEIDFLEIEVEPLEIGNLSLW